MARTSGRPIAVMNQGPAVRILHDIRAGSARFDVMHANRARTPASPDDRESPAK
jgi:hypothetical protein